MDGRGVRRGSGAVGFRHCLQTTVAPVRLTQLLRLRRELPARDWRTITLCANTDTSYAVPSPHGWPPLVEGTYVTVSVGEERYDTVPPTRQLPKTFSWRATPLRRHASQGRFLPLISAASPDSEFLLDSVRK